MMYSKFNVLISAIEFFMEQLRHLEKAYMGKPSCRVFTLYNITVKGCDGCSKHLVSTSFHLSPTCRIARTIKRFSFKWFLWPNLNHEC